MRPHPTVGGTNWCPANQWCEPRRMAKQQKQLDVDHGPEAEASLWWSCLSWSLNLWKKRITCLHLFITIVIQIRESGSKAQVTLPIRTSRSHQMGISPFFFGCSPINYKPSIGVPVPPWKWKALMSVASRLVMVIHTQTLLAAISWMPGLTTQLEADGPRKRSKAEAPARPCRRRWCFYCLHLRTWAKPKWKHGAWVEVFERYTAI